MHIKNLNSVSGDIIGRKDDGQLMTSAACPPELTQADPISPELLRRYDVAGPRYTSYPTADRFVEAFGEADYLQALEQRREGLAVKAYPLSLYVHIPFCESLCYYCACNKIITKHKDRAATYLRYLTREVELRTAHLGMGQSVSQLHLGGGTPTFLSDGELRELMQMLANSGSRPVAELSEMSEAERMAVKERIRDLIALCHEHLHAAWQPALVADLLTRMMPDGPHPYRLDLQTSAYGELRARFAAVAARLPVAMQRRARHRMAGEEDLVQEQREARNQQQHGGDEQQRNQRVECQVEGVIDKQRHDDGTYQDQASRRETDSAMDDIGPATQHIQFMHQHRTQSGSATEALLQRVAPVMDTVEAVVQHAQ